jgi:hypothetical protein
MELENRVETLERETAILKTEIRETLLNVQKNLLDKRAASSRWRRRAWVLSMLNLLLAIALFANIRFYASDNSSLPAGSTVGSWLQALWVALALLWLLLQMYPLALLLNQENAPSRETAWHNTARFFISNPGLTLALTLAVSVLAIVSALFPSLWLAVVVALFATVCVNAAMQLVRLYRKRGH